MDDPGFLADIIANPDDDAIRLVYGDWLQDHGQADRAEFIRIQVDRPRQERLLECLDYLLLARADDRDADGWDEKASARYYDAEKRLRLGYARERKLWAAHRHEWGRIPGVIQSASQELSWWSRGFLGYVAVTPRGFACWAGKMLVAAPITRVDFYHWPGNLWRYPPAGRLLVQQSLVREYGKRWPQVRVWGFPDGLRFGRQPVPKEQQQ